MFPINNIRRQSSLPRLKGSELRQIVRQHLKNARVRKLLFLVSFGLFSTACSQQMAKQPHVRPLESSTVFADGTSARPAVPGTIASGYTRTNHRLEPSPAFDPNSDSLPFALTRDTLSRGRERFNVYCSACHGETGEGTGIIVQRGFSKPPSYFESRLKQAPLGHFYDVMTNGYGAMASYAVQIDPSDRWAIAAYIRTLQASRSAVIGDVPAEKKSVLETGGIAR